MTPSQIRIAIIAACVIALVIVIASLTQCHKNDGAKQAQQISASGQAISNAAQSAIETISNRSVTESDIDNATATASEQIANASDPATVRGAVISAVCRSAAHRNDPACAQ